MCTATETTTIYYKLKLKRTRTPLEVFEKMAKKVKKKGATKNWVCNYDENQFWIDFCDGRSEDFAVAFDDKKVCDGFCRVDMPLAGELFDDEAVSEFKALINMIWSARTSFSVMEITDDYGLSESYIESKINKIKLRELTEEELVRGKRLFADGHTTVKEFIFALMMDLRGLEYREDYYAYINIHIYHPLDRCDEFSLFSDFVDSFLFETVEYKDVGRIYRHEDYVSDLTGLTFAMMAFLFGLGDITGITHLKNGGDPKGTQVFRLYHNKYLPLYEKETDDLERCILAYRFFVSIMDYLCFKYVGRNDKYLDLVTDETVSAIAAYFECDSHENYQRFDEASMKEFRRFRQLKEEGRSWYGKRVVSR